MFCLKRVQRYEELSRIDNWQLTVAYYLMIFNISRPFSDAERAKQHLK